MVLERDKFEVGILFLLFFGWIWRKLFFFLNFSLFVVMGTAIVTGMMVGFGVKFKFDGV